MRFLRLLTLSAAFISALYPASASAQCRLVSADSGLSILHPANGHPIESLFQSGNYHSFTGSGGSLYFTAGAWRNTAIYQFKKSDNSIKNVGRLTDLKMAKVDLASRTIIGINDFELVKIPLDNVTSREVLFSTGGAIGDRTIWAMDYDPIARIASIVTSQGNKWSILSINTTTMQVWTTVEQLPFTDGYLFPDLALDATDGVVFAILSSTYVRFGTVIYRYDLNTGQQQILSPKAPGTTISGLAIDRVSNKIFWGENGSSYPFTAYSADYNGNGKQLVHEVSAPITELAFDEEIGKPIVMTAQDFYFPEGGPTFRRMPFPAADKVVVAQDGDKEKLFFTQRQSGKIFSTDLRGDNTQLIAEVENQPIVALKIDPQRNTLYWVEGNGLISPYHHSWADNVIKAFDIAGRTEREVLRQDPGDIILALAHDAAEDKLYWIEKTIATYSIKRINSNGTGLELLATGLNLPQDIAVAGDRVYWGEPGVIRSMRKDGTDLALFAQVSTLRQTSSPAIPTMLSVDLVRQRLYVSVATSGSDSRVQLFSLLDGSEITFQLSNWAAGSSDIAFIESRSEFCTNARSFGPKSLREFVVWRPTATFGNVTITGLWAGFATQADRGSSYPQISGWGLPNDTPLMGDVTGDGAFDPIVWRPSQGNWFTRDLYTGGVETRQFGLPGDYPLVGQIDNDGKADKVVWRPSMGMWFLLSSATDTARAIQWGLPGDYPALADYDGDGLDDLMVWRPSSGLWFVLRSMKHYSRQPMDIMVQQWGLPGDHPMEGDFDGDGRSDLVVWRPTDGNWYICQSGSGFSCQNPRVLQFGLPGDLPLEIDIDGDSISDPAVFRRWPGAVFYLRSTDNLIVQGPRVNYLESSDLPVQMGIKDRIRVLYGRQ